MINYTSRVILQATLIIIINLLTSKLHEKQFYQLENRYDALIMENTFWLRWQQCLQPRDLLSYVITIIDEGYSILLMVCNYV